MQELLDSKQRGRERLSRVQRSGAAARDHTGSGGFEAVEREEAALLSSWEQWERSALQTRAGLETSLSQIASSEQEFSVLTSRLGQDLHDFSAQLHDCRLRLAQCEGKHSGEECVKAWQLAKVCFRLSAIKQAQPKYSYPFWEFCTNPACYNTLKTVFSHVVIGRKVQV